ncbi:MAG: hypothetical protein ABJE66_17860 [Deltaproteobacteria bacterium]
MSVASEKGPTPVSVVTASAQKTADRITGEQKQAGLDHIQTMSLAQILDAIGTDANRASLTVRARPGDVGELLQLGMATRQATALVLLAATRCELVRGADDREVIVRSILRVGGPGSSELKESMVALLKDRDKPAYQTALAKMDVDAIEKSRRDPSSAKLMANYVDRPDDCARQLITDSDDSERLTRDIAMVTTAVENQPQAGQALLAALAKSKDARRLKVRIELVRSLARSVRGDIRAVHDGHIAFDEPYKHAERVVPVLAEAMLQPEMAKRLLTMQSRGEAGELELRGLLHTCLFKGWNQAVRDQVARTTAKNAASMFEESLEEKDEIDRSGSSIRTAELMAEVSAVQAAELDVKFEKAALAFLKQVASFIPGPGGKAVKVLEIVVNPKDPEALWTRSAINQIMRRVYEREHPMPLEFKEDAAVEHEENAYTAWSAVPLDTYTSILSEKQ